VSGTCGASPVCAVTRDWCRRHKCLTPSLVLVCIWLIFTPSLAQAASLKVVATFTILADMVRQVAGPHAQVVTLVGPGGDAHTFDPSPADAGKLAGADLIVANGLGFEPWLGRMIAAADARATVITASDDVSPLRAASGPDPHAWQDPRNGGLYVRAIEFALKKIDPAHSSDFTANSDALTAQLDALDEAARKELSGVPGNRRKIITSHDAFGYFGRAYQVTMLAPEGISTDQEPSAGASMVTW
jgi:zinc/manganese transport system substrate-binding protein